MDLAARPETIRISSWSRIDVQRGAPVIGISMFIADTLGTAITIFTSVRSPTAPAMEPGECDLKIQPACDLPQ